MSVFGLRDAGPAVAALRADSEFAEDGSDGEDGGGLVRWDWVWDPPRPRARRREPGVRYTLCGEDAAARPALARVVVDLDAGEVCLLAPTPARLALAERLILARLGDAVGERTLHEVDPPSVVPRWKRAGFERGMIAALAGGRRVGRAA
jgi:hypothetical protein